MILSNIGDKIQCEGKDYVVGELVYASINTVKCGGNIVNVGSIYQGLVGKVKEIRTDSDKETQSLCPDIYVDFMQPVSLKDKRETEERFACFYGYYRKIEDLPFRSIITPPSMIVPVKWMENLRHKHQAYLISEDWCFNGERGYTTKILSTLEEARMEMRVMLVNEASNGLIACWTDDPNIKKEEKEDLFEWWLDGQYDVCHYSLRVTQQELDISQGTMSEIYNIQLAGYRAEDFLEEISQWEETEDLTEEQLAEMVQFTDIPNRIKEKLSTNSTYWSAYYESLSEASYEAVQAYLAHLRSEADPPYEG